MQVKISSVIDSEWLLAAPIRVGHVPATLATPAVYVTLADGERQILRVDVYPYDLDCFFSTSAIVWQENLIIGFGSHVHAISLRSWSVVTVPLESYFGYLYPTLEYLLIASGQRLFRMQPDRSISWKSELLGIDGVVVNDAGPPVVRGEGEWDPPGGWRTFAVLAANGRVSAGTSGDKI